MAKINCSMVCSLVHRFFDKSLKLTVRDLVLNHLLSCPVCLEKYKDFSKKNGYGDFEPLEDIFKLAKEYDQSEEIRNIIDKEVGELTKEYDQSEEIRNTIDKEVGELTKEIPAGSQDKWYQIASQYDIEKLLSLQSFRDLISEYKVDEDLGDIDYTEYYKYIIIKIAQKVDHLEHCLTKIYNPLDKKQKTVYNKKKGDTKC